MINFHREESPSSKRTEASPQHNTSTSMFHCGGGVPKDMFPERILVDQVVLSVRLSDLKVSFLQKRSFS